MISIRCHLAEHSIMQSPRWVCALCKFPKVFQWYIGNLSRSNYSSVRPKAFSILGESPAFKWSSVIWWGGSPHTVKRMSLALPSLQKVGECLPRGFNNPSVTTIILYNVQLYFHSFSNQLGWLNSLGGIIILHFGQETSLTKHPQDKAL